MDYQEFQSILFNIVKDEYASYRLSNGVGYDNEVSSAYFNFLVDTVETYRWYGIRNTASIALLWSDVRNPYVKDSDESTQSTNEVANSVPLELLTRILRRLVVDVGGMDKLTPIIEGVAIPMLIQTFHVYPNVSGNGRNPVNTDAILYDEQVETTVSTELLVTMLKNNYWLVVMAMLSLMPKNDLLMCLGHADTIGGQDDGAQ